MIVDDVESTRSTYEIKEKKKFCNWKMQLMAPHSENVPVRFQESTIMSTNLKLNYIVLVKYVD